MQTSSQSRYVITLTAKERQFMIATLKYELNLVVQLPDRNVMKKPIRRALRRFQNGLNVLNLRDDRIGKVKADGELIVDIEEYRLYHLYNVGDWNRSQSAIYGRLRKKLTSSPERQPMKFKMGA